jgi:haloacid dehalogenase-like hydrolase
MLRNAVVLLAMTAGMLLADPACGQEVECLRSWNQSCAKARIVDFVERVTDEDGDDFVPVEERIAVFDNDGTLWCEEPLVEAAFAQQRAVRLLLADPEWRQQAVFRGARHNPEFADNTDRARLIRMVAATHNGISQGRFQRLVASFFRTAKHPRYKVGYQELAYQPMLELLEYLRAHDFQTWICSEGGVHFIRVISEDVYGIPPQQVIGSSGPMEFRERDGEWEFFRPLDENTTIDQVLVNDQKQKPVSIELHIGRQPIFAAGNVRCAGDVDMLRYSQLSHRPNLQLLVHHDDADREFAYEEHDNASLDAAVKYGWTVVSMRDDWNRVFADSVGDGTVEAGDGTVEPAVDTE